jgi:uncharacterized protein YgbK (DUF1537 family)
MKIAELRARLPAAATRDYRAEIEKMRRGFPVRIVVLDDDPTGIQTVYGCRLLTVWDIETVRKALAGPEGFFYLLLNSRSVAVKEAERRCRDAIETVVRAAQGTDFRLLVISRSDSTLRGHFPAEPDTIHETLKRAGRPLSNLIPFCPALFEAGRYTYGDIQYVEQEQELIPAAQTEFATDSVFGYTSSDLRSYIIEKSGGRIARDDIGSIGLEELRSAPLQDISNRFRSTAKKSYLIMNAVSYPDLHKLACALLRWQRDSAADVVVRSSSSFVPAAVGLLPRGLLSPAQLFPGQSASPEFFRRGLVVVGSYVRKSSDQLQALLGWKRAAGIEIEVKRAAAGKPFPVAPLLKKARRAWSRGRIPVYYTTRKEIRLADGEKQLGLGARISELLARLVRGLRDEADFLITKGGISSHAVLSEGLETASARVLGQIAPGVPVVLPELHERRAYPCVVFPGNVGTRDSLREIAESLSTGSRA